MLRQEVNKRLMSCQAAGVAAKGQLLQDAVSTAAAAAVDDDLGEQDASKQAKKEHQIQIQIMFKEFIRALLSRAMAARLEGSDEIVLQLTESWVGSALDRLGTSLARHGQDLLQNWEQTLQSTSGHYTQLVKNLESKLHAFELTRELDKKAVARRVHAAATDYHYDLLRQCDVLTKENETLKAQLAGHQRTVRVQMQAEFEHQLQALHEENLLLKAKFKDYKANLYRDMQHNLGDIKRSAMLQIGKSDAAPLHMKRQALRIAVTDEEIGRLKDENAELHTIVTKMRLWNQLKMIHTRSVANKRWNSLQKEQEERAAKYWGRKTQAEEKESGMRAQLLKTQNQLTQLELEAEQLRRDLQLQLKSKQQIVAWRVGQKHQSMGAEGAVASAGPLHPSPGPNASQSQSRAKTPVSAKHGVVGGVDVDKLLAELQKKDSTIQKLKAQVESLSATKPPPSRSGAEGSSAELDRLKSRLSREVTLKKQAFAKLDQVRATSAPGGGSSANESAVLTWKQKCYTMATALQNSIQDLEMARTALNSAGISISLPSLTSGAFPDPNTLLLEAGPSRADPLGSSLPALAGSPHAVQNRSHTAPQY
eukprot:NODE_348_length_2197_cov_19.503724_g276_i0.p1 GENE.NODE_348_length_2197_cov_19.503724_g276_i0~~NODE_348_length_2197_cov_19.503724_g276_i0.p1  ORF type:complete len:692 (-),score=228.83 NODE_348_length_2197_cov_19.503724_g276_i0:122-1900(-)